MRTAALAWWGLSDDDSTWPSSSYHRLFLRTTTGSYQDGEGRRVSWPNCRVGWLALVSFLPPALITIYAAMIERNSLAVAGTLWLLGMETVLVMVNRRVNL